jgi:hypothetical protein
METTYIHTIKTIKNKNEQEVIVKYCSRLQQAPTELITLYYSQMGELYNNGHGPGWVATSTNNHLAIYTEIENEIVGFIIFDYSKDKLQSWISLSAVKENYRKQGLYQIMHDSLETITKKLGGIEIASFTHVDNIARLKSAESVGMLATHYRLSKSLISDK